MIEEQVTAHYGRTGLADELEATQAVMTGPV